MLDFNGILVPRTIANQILWELFTHPYRPVPVAEMLGSKRCAAINRITRAADALGQISPRLAVTLRSRIRWKGGVATYKPGQM